MVRSRAPEKVEVSIVSEVKSNTGSIVEESSGEETELWNTFVGKTKYVYSWSTILWYLS